MEKILHRAEARGAGEYGWLSTRYSFSFGDWFEPSRMGFGKLRVLNDDRIAPGSGFPMHAHHDMEILTVVTRGAVTHKDSLGNTGAVPAGDVQVMSAGTGVVHSEYNDSPTEPLELFQLWIEPNKTGVTPRYAQKSFRDAKPRDGFLLLASQTGAEGSLGIHQDAYVSLLTLTDERPFVYELMRPQHGVYAFVVRGNPVVAGTSLGARDALGITGAKEIRIEGAAGAELLLVEVPH